MFLMCLLCFASLHFSFLSTGRGILTAHMCTTHVGARRRCEVMDMVVGIKPMSWEKATNVINLYRLSLHSLTRLDFIGPVSQILGA